MYSPLSFRPSSCVGSRTSPAERLTCSPLAGGGCNGVRPPGSVATTTSGSSCNAHNKSSRG